jgi:hypothetical protein
MTEVDPTKLDAAHKRTSDSKPADTAEPRSFNPDAVEDGTENEEPKAPKSKLSEEARLDHGLKETFPASDPVSINPGSD